MSNRVYILDEYNNRELVTQDKIKNIKIKFLGDDNIVEIYKNLNILNMLSITCQSNCKIYIGNNCRIHSCKINAIANNSICMIGKQTCIIDADLILKDEKNLFIKIGERCLLSSGVTMRTTDGHTIYDINTNKILNKASSGINIGNHVWIGKNVFILKDVSIPENCIIGAGALVTSASFEKNSIIAGTPAKVIKRGVNWDVRPPEKFIDEVILKC